MTITIHLVRHAQGFHNLNTMNELIPDPYLTPFGNEQCAALAAIFPYHDRITHLVASPMRRTLLTCHRAFQPAIQRLGGTMVIALPHLQEISNLPCDTGSKPAVLRAEFGAWAGLALVSDSWTDKISPNSPWVPTEEAVEERARQACIWLREIARKSKTENTDIAVVTHGGFLHFLTQDWDGLDLTKGTGWDNAEYRSYEFDDPTGNDKMATLHETKDSLHQRQGSTTTLTAAQQEQQRAAVVNWYKEYFIATESESK